MLKKLMDHLFKEKQPDEKNYRIVQVQDRFIGEYFDGVMWLMIDEEGCANGTRRIYPAYTNKYGCDSKEVAGSRINLHSELSNGSIVWTGGG